MTRKDLDDIFAKVKKPAVSQGITKMTGEMGTPVKKSILGSKLSKNPVATQSTKSSRKGSAADPFALTPSQANGDMDFTEEGWKVYTPEELKIGKGRDTPDCPFDCDCCF